VESHQVLNGKKKNSCAVRPPLALPTGCNPTPPPPAEEQCKQKSPTASRTYSTPKGYVTADPGRNRFIRPAGQDWKTAPITMNPAYRAARNASSGTNWKGVASDLASIGIQSIFGAFGGAVAGNGLGRVINPQQAAGAANAVSNASTVAGAGVGAAASVNVNCP